MKKTAITGFVVLCIAAGLYLTRIFIHEALKPPSATIVWQIVDKRIIDLARRSYIPIRSEHWVGSGAQIGPTLAVICFHELNPGDTTQARGIPLDNQIIKISTKDDIVFFRTSPQKIPEIPIARKVKLGDVLVGVSNAGDNNGLIRYYWVAHITEHRLMVGQFGTATMGGESGSALFNLRGEIVGILREHEPNRYGIATPFNRIEKLKAEIKPTAP